MVAMVIYWPQCPGNLKVMEVSENYDGVNAVHTFARQQVHLLHTGAVKGMVIDVLTFGWTPARNAVESLLNQAFHEAQLPFIPWATVSVPS